MTQTVSDLQIVQELQEKVPSLKYLNALAGEWNIKIADPSDPAAVVYGQTSFKWLPGQYFMVQDWNFEGIDFPAGIAIHGWSAITRNFSQHYYDSRGIARIYEMSLDDSIWRIWRVMPGFSQRFKGTFADNGNTILGYWEKSVDDSIWDYDFDILYTRVKTENTARAIPLENQEQLSFELME